MTSRPIAHKRKSDCEAILLRCLREFTSYEESNGFIVSAGLRELICELATDNERLLTEMERSGKANAAILNRPELLHFAVLANVDAPHIDLLLKAVAHPTVRKHFPLAGIWASYADCLVALFRSNPSPQPTLKATGGAKRYVPYVQLMCASDATERANASSAIAVEFKKWNKDKRAINWVGLDGDGMNPVQWDFRHTSLMKMQQVSQAASA